MYNIYNMYNQNQIKYQAIGGGPVKISVVIPVYNETDTISNTIRVLREQCHTRPSEIIVVDGNADGNTIAAIQDERVLRLKSAKGRAVQMNKGAAAASGDILLFLHADTLLPPQAFEKINDVMENDRYVAGAFKCASKSTNLFIKHIYYTSYLRSRISRIPYGDQAIFVRKDYFDKIGGYPEIPILEDVELMKKIKKDNQRICILEDIVLTSSRRYEEEGMIFGWLRNHRIRISHYFGIPPERLAKLYPDTRRTKTKGF